LFIEAKIQFLESKSELLEKGYSIARISVAKYRELLVIPMARMRKKT